MSKQKSNDFFVVGIGASAGGLEALEQFFDHMNVDSGMSFVIVQHLSPNYKSFMTELLARHSSMNIIQAEHEMEIKPDCVYLIPPKKNMTIINRTLQLTDHVRTPQGAVNLPIDLFFHSLATDVGNRSIAVVLSGTGSDGSRGISAIKQAGGLVIAQDEKSAKFDGMPYNARLSGHVDYVLAPAKIPETLLQYTEQLKKKLRSGDRQESDQAQNQERNIRQIFELVRQSSGVDFNYYKRNSVMRRVNKRMAMCKISEYNDYMKLLTRNNEEIALLRKDLLIGVTEFFRDKEAFDKVSEQVIPAIFKAKESTGEIRIWVAGCSTGEEAYSLAILCKEYMDEQHKSNTVKIFATDLDVESIEFASQGLYHENAVRNMPSALLNRYFEKAEDSYQISKEIRRMVVFAPHNIIKDPPFSNLDLITCRNMLIYLNSETQQKVLALFHFVLNHKGYLFLGPSETIGKLNTYFNTVDQRWNIYQHQYKKDKYALQNPVEELARFHEPVTHKPDDTLNAGSFIKKVDELYLTFLDEHMPPSILIDENNDIVHLSGRLEAYISFAKGKPSWNIYKVMDSNLSIAVSTAIHKVRKEQQEVTYASLKIHNYKFDEDEFIQLTIRPFSTRNERYKKLVLVIFEELPDIEQKKVGTGDSRTSYALPEDVNHRIIELQKELQYAEETLQATTEELETSNEELQATNEEMVAANEELQSTNEELQSVNEELVTVNTEYQFKIEELTELNNDMNNFLISTKMATIFLDKKMCVRRFTPAASKEINLMEVDYGRPIAHISHNFKDCNLVEAAEQVLKTLEPIETEVQTDAGKWYSMKVLPYRTSDHFINGTVFTFVDVTELKKANQELMCFSYVIQQSPSIIIIADLDGKIEFVNPQYERITGYSAKDATGKNLFKLTCMNLSRHKYREIQETIQKGDTWVGELESIRKDGSPYWESVKLLPIKNEQGRPIQILRVSEDMTNLKTTQELLRKSEMLSGIGQLAAGIAHEIRNPLTALKGFTQLISSGSKSQNYISIMAEELNRIEDIVSELLVLSRPQSVDFCKCNVIAIIKDVIMMLDTQAIMNRVDIRLDSELAEANVLCIENQLKQVFINIVKNALEAMPTGGNIIVSIKETESDLMIEIQDTGMGIPQDVINRVGEPFFSTKDKGTGLGLMVSYKIVEHHDGELSIQSEKGNGTRITIRLPKEDVKFLEEEMTE